MHYGQLDGTGCEYFDERAGACIIAHARIERVWTGARWSEGPAWFPAHRTLVWSDIPNDRLLRYDEASGHVGTFRQPSCNANGNTVDREGRLVTCEHLTRRVTRTEHDGRVVVLADRWDGMRFNSPNDVVVKSDGSVWFTDPDYGILSSYEGHAAESEIGKCQVYRADPDTGDVTVVADDFVKPNGLAFSPDESLLYIADTGATHQPGGPRHIRRFKVASDGRRLGKSTVFAECKNGLFDGFRCDEAGRIWTSAGTGVEIYDPDGALLARVKIPELVSNVAFGGPRLNRLFICGTSSLYAMFTAVHGISPFERP